MTTIIGAKGPSHPKLPLWRTIRLSYSDYFQQFRDVLRISVFWLAITAMFDAAMGWMQASWMAHVLANPRARLDLTPPVEMTVLGNIDSVAVALACVSIAVAWHRLLLLDEQPGRSGGNLVTSAPWLIRRRGDHHVPARSHSLSRFAVGDVGVRFGRPLQAR